MSMFDAASDRDYTEECHGPYDGSTVTRPCKLCRASVRVPARTSSLFATVLCEGCTRTTQATQDRKMDRGAA